MLELEVDKPSVPTFCRIQKILTCFYSIFITAPDWIETAVLRFLDLREWRKVTWNFDLNSHTVDSLTIKIYFNFTVVRLSKRTIGGHFSLLKAWGWGVGSRNVGVGSKYILHIFLLQNRHNSVLYNAYLHQAITET